MNATAPTAPTAPSEQQPTQEEVHAAIAREQQQQMGYLHDRVMQLSIANARLEAELATFRAAEGQPAT